MLYPAGMFYFWSGFYVSMIWVTNMHQQFVPLICLSRKNAVTVVHFLCASVMYVCHNKTCGIVPPKSTLSELNRWFYGVIGNSWGCI